MWGLQFVANHELLVVLTASEIVVVRFLAVFVCLLVALAMMPSLRPSFRRADILFLLVAGALAVPGSQLTLVRGQRFLAPAMAGLVVATQPAITAALSAVILRETLTRRKIFGVLLALLGAAVVVLFATGGGTDLTIRNPWGASLVLLAQASFSLYTVLTKRVQGRMPPLTLTAAGLLFGAIWLLPLAPAAISGISAVGGWRALWFVQLVVGGTLIPYAVWNLALTTLPANETASYTFLIPLFGLLWSWTILGEEISPIGLLGGLLIIVGVVLTQRRRAPARSSPAA